MKAKLKDMLGSWHTHENVVHATQKIGGTGNIRHLAIAMIDPRPTLTMSTAIAIAQLIAEAGTVATETGLTPRQLAEQRQELLEACKQAKAILEHVFNCQDTVRDLTMVISKAERD